MYNFEFSIASVITELVYIFVKVPAEERLRVWEFVVVLFRSLVKSCFIGNHSTSSFLYSKTEQTSNITESYIQTTKP